MTGIQWTEETWNPTTGCDRVSPGCDNCYALGMAKRLKGMGSAKYQTDGDPRTSGPGFGIAEHADALELPLRWRKPRKVFVNSMSDLFHDGVSHAFLVNVFATMAATPQHTYQILTKRHGRMRSLLNRDDFRASVWDHFRALTRGAMDTWSWPLPNVWLGVSVEDQKYADLRIPALLGTPAAVRFLSCEPLLGPVGLHPEWSALDWAIVGGESGPGARPMHLTWVENLLDDCRALGIAPFVKQLGSVHGPGKGGDMALWPAELRVREFPAAVTS
jgi:protein gp37